MFIKKIFVVLVLGILVTNFKHVVVHQVVVIRINHAVEIYVADMEINAVNITVINIVVPKMINVVVLHVVVVSAVMGNVVDMDRCAQIQDAVIEEMCVLGILVNPCAVWVVINVVTLLVLLHVVQENVVITNMGHLQNAVQINIRNVL